MPTIIEYADPLHRDQVIALWRTVFAYPQAHNAPALVIDRKLATRDALFFVALTDGAVAGTVMAGYDGHRGWLYSVAVHPTHRKQRMGTDLVRHAEAALTARGCLKINLQIADGNEAVAGFYETLGYCVETRVSMGRITHVPGRQMAATPTSGARAPFKLFGSTDSGHSYKVRAFLLLSGTPHHYQWIDLGVPRSARPAELIAASRFGEVPVLVDQGQALCQSNAILVYLAQQTQAFCGREGEWQSVLEWLSWEANRIGFSVPNLRFALLWVAQPPDVVAYLRARVLADLRTLDSALASSEFLLPSGPSIADISCCAYLFWLSQIGIAEADYPHVQRWLAALRALPGWVHPDEAMQPPLKAPA